MKFRAIWLLCGAQPQSPKTALKGTNEKLPDGKDEDVTVSSTLVLFARKAEGNAQHVRLLVRLFIAVVHDV